MLTRLTFITVFLLVVSGCGEKAPPTGEFPVQAGHCEVDTIEFQDAMWVRAPDDRPDVSTGGKLPDGWAGVGSMTRVSDDIAVYVDNGSGTPIVFRLEDTMPSPPPCF